MNGCVFQAAYVNKIYRMNDFFNLFFVSMWVQVHTETRRGRGIPWNWRDCKLPDVGVSNQPQSFASKCCFPLSRPFRL